MCASGGNILDTVFLERFLVFLSLVLSVLDQFRVLPGQLLVCFLHTLILDSGVHLSLQLVQGFFVRFPKTSVRIVKMARAVVGSVVNFFLGIFAKLLLEKAIKDSACIEDINLASH